MPLGVLGDESGTMHYRILRRNHLWSPLPTRGSQLSYVRAPGSALFFSQVSEAPTN